MVINVKGKNKSGKGQWGVLETAVSNWVVNWVEIFPEKRAFEQTPESREDVSYGDF